MKKQFTKEIQMAQTYENNFERKKNMQIKVFKRHFPPLTLAKNKNFH